jgi:hypothetical protein
MPLCTCCAAGICATTETTYNYNSTTLCADFLNPINTWAVGAAACGTTHNSMAVFKSQAEWDTFQTYR